MKTKTLIKTVVFAGCAGATAFCLYKAWKIAKEYWASEEAKDRLEDAVRLSKELKDKPIDHTEDPVEPLREAPVASEGHSGGSIIPIPTTINVEKAMVSNFQTQMTDFEERLAAQENVNDEEETEDDPQAVRIIEDTNNEEGVEELRFPPESDEAYFQYVDMKLADIRDENTRRVLKLMYDEPYIPVEDDAAILANCLDDREAFFGPDNARTKDDDLTVGDLIMYLATCLDTDLDGGVEYWVGEMLRNLGIEDPSYSPDITEDLINNEFQVESDHEVFYGIFQLRRSEMESVGEGIQQQFWDFCKRIMREEG
jgi:hypothetical protein